MAIARYVILENSGKRVNRATIIEKDENNKPLEIESHFINPGTNFIEAVAFSKLEKNLEFKFASKEYKILHKDNESKLEYTVSKDFNKLTLKQAEDLVGGIYSIKTLEWLKQDEFRDSIRAKIMNQIDNMVNYTKNKKKKVEV